MQCDSITHTGQIPRPNLPREPDIPRQIWGFWDKDEIPPLVQRCINTWFIVHFNWDIHIVTPENVSTYLKPGVDIPKNLMRDEEPAKQSDMIRFALLYKYGGVYIDATTLMTYPGVAWMRTNYRDWFSFDGEINIIASAPKGRVISILYPAMFQMLSWKRGVERFKMIRKTYNITSPYLYTQHVIQRILKMKRPFPILGNAKEDLSMVYHVQLVEFQFEHANETNPSHAKEATRASLHIQHKISCTQTHTAEYTSQITGRLVYGYCQIRAQTIVVQSDRT